MITDATSDMSLQLIDQYQIEVIPMPFIIGEREYTHYADAREVSVSEFYRRLRSGEIASTAQVNVATYLTYFENSLQQGRDIIYICFSSGLSGMIQSANMAIAELKEKYRIARFIVWILCVLPLAKGCLFTLLHCRRKRD